MMNSLRWTMAVMPVFFAACSSEWQSAREISADGYAMLVKTTPQPLQVGETAEISVLLKDPAGEAVNGCQGRFRQYMPGMEMSSDNVYIIMADNQQHAGYSAHSREFSMGGDWTLEFELTCAGQVHRANLDYQLEWPE